MSNSSTDRESLDVDKLFLWFTTIFGSQKMTLAWDGVPHVQRSAVWSSTLAKYPARQVYAAMHKLAEHGSAWPPTLPEFAAMVRDAAVRPEHRPSLPVPQRTAKEVEAGAQRAATAVTAAATAVTDRKDTRAWAHKVLKRHEERDGSISPVAVAFAREALSKRANA